MSALTYKCPNCDGGLIFDPASQKFVCEYCLSKYTDDELKKLFPDDEEEQFEQTQSAGSKQFDKAENSEFEDNAVVYSCPSCGAEVVTDATTAATFCYYCHNPVVLSSRLDGSFKPDKVVPFIIERNEAIERFMLWAKKKWFIPKYFFSKDQIDKITGVYFPHWVVDTDVVGRLNTNGKKVRTWTMGDTRYTETKNYQVIREADIHLEDITRSALNKANKQLVDGIHPFDDKSMIDFSMGYLSGFQAEKRDIERNMLEQEVVNEIARYARTLTSETANEYIGVTDGDVNVDIKTTDWSYALLPVWTLTYKGKDGKIYYYAMNGQSGKTCGKLPIDFKKLAILLASVTLPLFGIFLLGGYLL